MSKANAMGTKLYVNEKVVGALKSINGIDISAGTIDVTNLSSEGGFKEFIAGTKEVSDVTFAGFMDGADNGQDECYSLIESGEEANCKIVFPAKIGKTWTFKGIVSKFATGAEVDNAVSFESAIKVSGKPTLAASASAAG